ncbi:hypothetical protein MTR67_031416 [Solanum verrucosum]|uniref:Uncharacterized protein n=1 Tax=Solanum verrucosum TaxID=315347 RepID=A0AAF0U2H9_SOLVR|nr:hypothetical protein MTR67_031416 [Solanum verrucosum]
MKVEWANKVVINDSLNVKGLHIRFIHLKPKDKEWWAKEQTTIRGIIKQLSMGSVAHVKDNKKEFARDIHILARLGVRLVDFNEGGMIVHISSESSLVSNMKAKKDLDPVLMDLNKSVSKKAIKSFF